MACRDDLRKAHSTDGRKAPVSRALEYMDDARRKPFGHGTDRYQDAAGHEGAGTKCRRHSATGVANSECTVWTAGDEVNLRRKGCAGLLRQRGYHQREDLSLW